MEFKLNASDAHSVYSNDCRLTSSAKRFIIKQYSQKILLENNIIEEELEHNKSGYSEAVIKGNKVEHDNSLFCQEILQIEKLYKNTEMVNSKYFSGICDYINDDLIVEIKSPFNLNSFYDNLYNNKKNHYLQVQLYLYLYKKKKGILFYGLQNYKNNNYDNLKKEQKWSAYEINYDKQIVAKLAEIVKKSNEYLYNYIKTIDYSVGKITKLHYPCNFK